MRCFCRSRSTTNQRSLPACALRRRNSTVIQTSQIATTATEITKGAATRGKRRDGEKEERPTTTGIKEKRRAAIWQMTECNLSPICSPRVHHTQTLLRSPASLSSLPLRVSSAALEVLTRLLCLSPFVQRAGKEGRPNRRRVGHAREPVGQPVGFTIRRPGRPLDRCPKSPSASTVLTSP